MLIEFEDGSPFATGGAEYNTLPHNELSDHVVLIVELGGHTEHPPMWEAVVHTTVPYLICPLEIAQAVGIDKAPVDVEGGVLMEGKLIEGRIYRGATLTLLADEDKGQSVQQPVWAFVPNSDEDLKQEGLPKLFLGMKHCLDRFLFAVDPYSRVFYFGGEEAV